MHKKREKITNEQLLDALRWMEQATGRVTQAEFCRRMKLTRNLIVHRFGGWLAMRRAAGLEGTPLQPGCRIDADELVAELRRRIQHNSGITQQEFCRAAGVSFTTIYRRFGGWNQLRALVGLPPKHHRGYVYTREDVLEQFRRLLKIHGPRMTRTQFFQSGGVAESVVARLFGSWGKLREAMQLSPNKPQRPAL